MDVAPWIRYVEALELSPLFVTVSGAHLYGFDSLDSDVDLRGAHVFPLRDVVGLTLPAETIDRTTISGGVEVDIVSHEIRKYLRLLVKNNGYILEQVFSPLVVVGGEFLDRLRPIASHCITRHHYHHYRGFYATQRKLIEKETPKRVKPILYAYRVLMTGIHLLNTGQVEANIRHLNDDFRLAFMNELIASKVTEKAAPENVDWPFHAQQLDLLERRMQQAFVDSTLPEDRDCEAVNELLIEIRLDR